MTGSDQQEGGNSVPPNVDPVPVSDAMWWWVAMVAAVAAAVGLSFWLAEGEKSANSAYVDAAAVLVFVTAIAAGVERLIELFWGVIDRSAKKGAWWPLSVVTDSLVKIENDMNAVLKPLATGMAALIADAKPLVAGAGDITANQSAAAADLEVRLAAARKAIANAQKQLTPGSSRFTAIARAGDDFTRDALVIAERYQLWSADLETKINEVSDGLARAADIVGAFKDNPSRRAMSILFGVTLAVVAAGVLRLNLFAAILGADTPDYLLEASGIVATGVVMGLGASPTHEVIKALQRRKEDVTVDVPVGTAVAAVQTTAAAVGPTGAGVMDLRMRNAETGNVDAIPVVYVTTLVTQQRTRRIRNAG